MSNVADQIASHSADAAVAQESTDEGKAASKKSPLIYKLSVAWLIALLVITVLGRVFGESLPLLVDPTARDADKIAAGPSWSNLMGNTTFGQDVLSQVVEGAWISLFVGLTVTFVGIIVGGAMGLVAGYYRGRTDSIVRLVINVTLSIPALLLVIFIVTIRGQELVWVVAALSLLAIPALARIVRASTLQVADREYVKAAEVLGVKRSAILFREVLPNVLPSMISFAFLTTGIVIVVEGTLSFLGLSVKPPAITWGKIIAEGQINIEDTPHMVVMPSLVIFLTVLALNFVGDQLLKRYDIREAGIG